MVWKGFKDVQATVIIDLKNKNEEDLFKQLDRSRRKNINKAKANGLIFNEANEKEWLEYYKIHEKVWREGGLNPIKFENLKKANYKLFVVKKEGQVFGGGVIEIEEDKIKFRAFASLIELQNMRINDFLYWNNILWALKNGKRYVDLGGYQLNAKLGDKLYHVNKFKEMWGGKIKVYPVYSYNPFYILGRKMIRSSRIMKWVWDRIKLRPLRKKKEYQ
jgi:lipid II:glycine glycyltransferase (peptidoglycan interpeptide bridge formation enzyme)